MKTNFKKMLSIVTMLVMLISCIGISPNMNSEAAGNIVISGVDMGYAAGQYFSTTGKACVCHGQGTCAPQTNPNCTCIHVEGTAQCYAFALWCENKLFGKNDVGSSGSFYSLGSIAAGNVTASSIKNLLYGKAVPGAHIRTSASKHSMVIMTIDENGFTVAQANGSNNREYSTWSACRIGTSSYTWESYASSTYGSRGIEFVNVPKDGISPPPTSNLTPDSKYSSYLPLQALSKTNADIYPYKSDCKTPMENSEIWPEDICVINEIYTNGWCKVDYKAGSQTKTGYVPLTSFFVTGSPSLSTYNATNKLDAYSRTDKAIHIGSVYAGDKCYVVGSSDGMTQLIYPIKDGYKLGFVNTSAAPPPETTTTTSAPVTILVKDSKYSSYLPLQALSKTNADIYPYKSDCKTPMENSEIWPEDICVINEIYTNGWCKVDYKAGSQTKTGYVPLTSFFVTGSPSLATYNAATKLDAYSRTDKAIHIGSVYAGDKCYVVGSSDGMTQLIYPITGGYKLGFVQTPTETTVTTTTTTTTTKLTTTTSKTTTTQPQTTTTPKPTTTTITSTTTTETTSKATTSQTTTTTTQPITTTSKKETTTTETTTTTPIVTLPAKDAPQLVVGNVKGKPGEAVEVSVEIRNNPGILAAGLEIEYDTKQMKLIGVTNGELMAEKRMQHSEDFAKIPYAVTWGDAGDAVAEDGIMVTFCFEITEDAETESLPLTLRYDPSCTFDIDLETVTFTVVNGTVSIESTPEGMIGDVNNDKSVDLKDVVLIRRYIVGGWDVSIDEKLADVNVDGNVDLKDVVLIRRYIVGGWDVTLG